MDLTSYSDHHLIREFRKRRRPLLSLREWWWNLDRRRHVAQVADADCRHVLDEDYAVDALARQLEEIRNLPEVAC